MAKLSVAIMLGDTLRIRDENCFLKRNDNDEWCGCAIGGAALAMGNTNVQAYFLLWPWLREPSKPMPDKDWATYIGCYGGMLAEYPGIGFLSVMRGKHSFEELVDYIRSVEPECGECCEFQCKCEIKKGEDYGERCVETALVL